VHHKGECVLDKIDCINDSFIKNCFQGPSEIFSPFFQMLSMAGKTETTGLAGKET
jgi:hypothetical protein